MNSDVLIRGVLESVLGGRRKRSRKALRYLTGGHSSWLSNPTTLLTAAGLAWGVYETLQQTPAPPAPGGAAGAPSTPPVGSTQGGTPLPPLPVLAASGAPPDDVMRTVQLAVAAAYADGSLSEAEREAVLEQADAAGVRACIEDALRQRRPLADIVRGVSDPAVAATLYVLAFTVVRADEAISGADRIFLAQLAHLIGLDPAAVSRLEAEASRRIDTDAG